MTMQARIAAMKEQNWVDSDEFVKANATSLSPECRDLLDKIFIADEFKRITLQVGAAAVVFLLPWGGGESFASSQRPPECRVKTCATASSLRM
jgi:hypothetical protein